MATGGGVLWLGSLRLSIRSTDNPLIGLSVLLAARYAFFRSTPLLGVAGWSIRDLDARARAALPILSDRLAGLSRRRSILLVVATVSTAIVLKAIYAYADPGFFSGDDVEVQEMALKALRHTSWPIWDLRNAFFPIGFIYPAQRALSEAGMVSVPTLVFGGRLAVAILSSLTIWALWEVSRRTLGGWGWPAVTAIAFAAAKMSIAFGSSELPRPVAALFVVSGFGLLQSRSFARNGAAGILLGLAACFRFSEYTFVLAAAGYLCWQRRFSDAVLVISVATATATAVLGLCDLWYWGDPFHSLRAALDYTLVKRLSSRGYQGPFWYLLHAVEWTNPVVLLLALFAGSRRLSAATFWAWLPLIALSVLPHKEGRYAIPLLPFLYLEAAAGAKLLIERTSDLPRHWPLAFVAVFLVSLLQDVGHWRLPRTNDDVRFLWAAEKAIPTNARLAGEQAWRFGGHLYLGDRDLVDLDPALITSESILQHLRRRDWLILDTRSLAQPGVAAQLERAAYRRLTVLPAHSSRYTLWTPEP